MGPVTLELPPRSPYVGVARLAIAALARRQGLHEEVVDDLLIAVSEAVTNALLATEEEGSDEAVTVRWDGGPDEVAVHILDRGRVYDPEAALDPSDTQSLRFTLSLALLQSLVDRCDFGPRDGGGMRTTLILNL